MRLFETLDKLNLLDEQNGTANVGLLPDVISVNSYTKHGDIKMGLPKDVADKLALKPERYKPILMVIDMDEYNKLNS